VTLLIPMMAQDLGESVLQVQWVSSAYTLAFAWYVLTSWSVLPELTFSGLLFSGRLADTAGRKKLYMMGLAVYAVFAIITGAVKVRSSASATYAYEAGEIVALIIRTAFPCA
jgi:MFS family permease